MSFFKYFIGIVVTIFLLSYVFTLIVVDKTNHTNLTDKMVFSFFSYVPIPNGLRNYFSRFTVPKFDFDTNSEFVPLSYDDLNFWAAHPEKIDSADVSPEFFNFDKQKTSKADVFFVHPTTFVSSKNWNQLINLEIIKNEGRPIRYLQDWSLRDQASAFNSCCKVYAPYYRQATLASFLSLNGNGGKALDFAYQDVRDAFAFFLKNFNQDRPFIIAGHSQGSRHIIKLLNEEIIGSPLMKRLVVAYTIGYPSDPIPGLSVCKYSKQVNCQISWNTEAVGTNGRKVDTDEICVNPLSWEDNNKMISKDKNLGSISFSESKKLSLNLVGAKCMSGKLLINSFDSEYFRYMPFGKGVYHHYDFSLFHMNIRENAIERVSAFLSDN